MKKLLLLGFLMIPGLVLAQAPKSTLAPLVGYWEGAYLRQGSVQILKMELEEQQGALQARFTVPDWGILKTPSRGEVTYADGHLSFTFLYGPTTLLVDAEAGEMRGTVLRRDSTQWPLHLKRTLRPVEPHVVSEEVRFHSTGVTMAGTLLLPPGPGPHPAVIIVSGRGYGTRWGQYSEALRLAQRGVAALIFDGRGRGESGGDRQQTTAEDRYADVLGALDLLAARNDLDPDQIGLWGISAGGWVIPTVAQRSGRVAFLIMDVGPAESLADQQGHVVEYRMRWFAEEPFTEDDYQAAFAYQKKLVELSWEGAAWEVFAPLVAHAREQSWSAYVDVPDDLDNGELDYFRRRKDYDAGPALRQTTIPVLAFYGERDFVVPPPANVPTLERYLHEAGNTDFEIHVFPGGDHSMRVGSERRGEGDDFPGLYFRWARLAPRLHETIYAWILAHVDVQPTP